MTLRPRKIASVSLSRGMKMRTEQAPIKKMVIDCRHDSHWNAIHDGAVNGVVLRRRPIRAIETFLDQAQPDVFQAVEFSCAQNRLRTELQKHLVIENDEDDIRGKFLINDIANHVRVMINQTRSRDFLFRLCPELPTEFHCDPAGLKMVITFRGARISFRQPGDKDIRDFKPYGVALFRGQAYESPVEWKAERSGEKAFYLTVEPAQRRRLR